MAYVQPSTNIVLIKNCILQKSDNNETDTLYFETKELQTRYFDGLGNKVEYSPTTYQNMGQGVMRIGKTMKQLYGCNYMYFTNKDTYTDNGSAVDTPFEGKRYYCFIDGLKYINNNCTEVYYSIDYIQTFMFDYDEKTCLVERMTTDDDTIGKYLQPEPVTYSTNQFCYGRYEIKSYNTYSVAYPMLCQPEFIYYTIVAEADSLTGIFLNISGSSATGLNLGTGYAAMCVTLQVKPYTNLFGILDLDNGGKSNAKVSVPNYSLLTGMTVDGYIKVVDDLTIVTTTPPSGYPAVGTVYTFTTLNVNNAYIQQLFSGDWWHGISGHAIDWGTSGTDRYARFVNNISSAIVFPTEFKGTSPTEYVGNIIDIALQKTYWKHFVKRDSLFGIDTANTYVPKNNKLLTYPFKYGMYGTLSGERMEYRYELLPTSITSYSDDVNYADTENDGLRFSILHCILPTPTALCVARNYYCNNLGYYYGMNQGEAQYDGHSYEFGVAFNDFPSIPTTIDGYNEYLAETSSSFRTGLLKSLLNISLVRHATETEQKKLTADAITAKGVHYAGVEAAKAGISAGLSYLERQTNAALNHNTVLGVFSAPNLITSAGYSGFYFWDYGVDVESAKVIDAYFTRYGYKLNINTQPSRNNNGHRKNFTFIKTIECNLAINQHKSIFTGFTMSQEDEKAIEAIYNNGVRFWYGTDGNGRRYYKDYSVTNEIVNGG